MLVSQLDEVTKKHPDVDLDMNYFTIVFNLLNIDEIDLADAVFDKISEEFFTRTIKDHVIQAGKDTQEMITLRNELESTDIVEVKASIINRLVEVTKHAELLMVISGFLNMAEKSDYINNNPLIDKFEEILQGMELEFDLHSGLPTLN